MTWLAILLLLLGIIVGIYGQICASSGPWNPGKTFAGFLLPICLGGGGVFLLLFGKEVISAKIVPLSLLFCGLILVASVLMTAAMYWWRRLEERILGRSLLERQCGGCVDCFMARMRNLLEVSRLAQGPERTGNE